MKRADTTGRLRRLGLLIAIERRRRDRRRNFGSRR